MITAAREHLATQLAPLGIPVHAYPPAVIAPPAAVIIPDDPYYRRHRLSGDAARIGLEVQLITSTAAGPAAQRALDDLIHTAVRLLEASPATIGEVGPPQPDDQAGTLTARLPVTIDWKE